MNDLRIMRERQLAVSAALDRLDAAEPYGSAALCVITTTVTSYPTTANVFYGCLPELITGSETEGARPHLRLTRTQSFTPSILARRFRLTARRS